MRTLTIENLPDDLYARLKDRADRNRRSLNAEAIVCLEHSLDTGHRPAEEVIAEATKLNREIDAQFSEELVTRGKREGRK